MAEMAEKHGVDVVLIRGARCTQLALNRLSFPRSWWSESAIYRLPHRFFSFRRTPVFSRLCRGEFGVDRATQPLYRGEYNESGYRRAYRLGNASFKHTNCNAGNVLGFALHLQTQLFHLPLEGQHVLVRPQACDGAVLVIARRARRILLSQRGKLLLLDPRWARTRSMNREKGKAFHA